MPKNTFTVNRKNEKSKSVSLLTDFIALPVIYTFICKTENFKAFQSIMVSIAKKNITKEKKEKNHNPLFIKSVYFQYRTDDAEKRSSIAKFDDRYAKWERQIIYYQWRSISITRFSRNILDSIGKVQCFLANNADLMLLKRRPVHSHKK